MNRPEQRCCRHEPPFPDHDTVMTLLMDPSLVVHTKSERCDQECPHDISVCGEFDHDKPIEQAA